MVELEKGNNKSRNGDVMQMTPLLMFKNEPIDYVLITLNSFHPNISFTYEK